MKAAICKTARKNYQKALAICNRGRKEKRGMKITKQEQIDIDTAFFLLKYIWQRKSRHSKLAKRLGRVVRSLFPLTL